MCFIKSELNVQKLDFGASIIQGERNCIVKNMKNKFCTKVHQNRVFRKIILRYVVKHKKNQFYLLNSSLKRLKIELWKERN